MITLDETIAQEKMLANFYKNQYEFECDYYGKSVVDSNKNILTCAKLAEDHEQLAEWLEELKALKNGLNIKCDNLNEALEKGKKIGYNMAIDDVESEFLKCDKVHYNLQDILRVLNKLKGEVAE